MSKIICNLLDNNNNLIPMVIGGIDTTNLLSANVHPYTATQDCVVLYATRNSTVVYIDGQVVMNYQADSETTYSYTFYLKKGQTFDCAPSNNWTLKVYGIKY